MSEQFNQEPGDGGGNDAIELPPQTEVGEIEVSESQPVIETDHVNPSIQTELDLNQEPMEQIVSQNMSFEMNDFINSCNGTEEQLYFVVENQIGEECLISPLTIVQNDQNVQISFEPNQGIDTQTTQSYVETNTNSIVADSASAVSNENVAINENKLNEIPTNKNIVFVKSSELEEPSSNVIFSDNKSQQFTLSVSQPTNVVNLSTELTTTSADIQPSYLSSEEINAEPTCPMSKQLSSLGDTSRKYFDNISKDLNLSDKKVNSKVADNKTVSRVSTKSTNNSKVKNSGTQDSILDNFVQKSQLSKSPRTYSRSNNVIWITPDSSKNENGLNSNKIETPKSKSLTTTIEIASDDTNCISSNNKNGADSVLDNSDVSDTAKIDLPPTIPESTTIENVLSSLTYDDEKLKEIESFLNEETPKIDIKTAEESKILPKAITIKGQSASLVDSTPKKNLRATTITKTEIKPAVNQGKRNSPRLNESHTEVKADSPKIAGVKTNSNSVTTLKNKKKVAFNLDANNVLDSGLKAEESSSSTNGPQTGAEVIAPTRAKERRDVVYYSDYKVDDLSVHIRIQPDIRPSDSSDESLLLCGHCGLNSRSLKLYQIHKKLCSFSSPSKIYNSIKSSPSKSPKTGTLAKRRKVEIIQTNDETQPASSSLSNTNDIEMVADTTLDESNDNDSNDDEMSDASLSSDETKSLDGHTENDVIWVSTKYGYWPALILRVLFNERKLALRLIDCPLKKESLKIQVSSVISFNNASVNKKMLKECKNYNDQLIKAVQKVEEYLRKRCLGTSINPIKFFNFAELFETNNKQADTGPKEVDTGENKVKTNAAKNIPPIQIENSKILETIKVEKKIETHLIGVYRGNIDSDFHRKFVTNVEDEDKSMHSTGFGPFKDGEEKDELIEYLKQLFNNENIIYSISYIFEVWAPEAIIKAITRVYHVSYQDAVSIYNSY